MLFFTPLSELHVAVRTVVVLETGQVSGFITETVHHFQTK